MWEEKLPACATIIWAVIYEVIKRRVIYNRPIQYIMDLTGYTRKTVWANLMLLTKRGLIEKHVIDCRKIYYTTKIRK